ncbi:HAMP domain-containing sensor histidine kinase [Nitratireductor sp. StC3]|uniref:sensor histidine kinase n=1 Tax=Nitratireductor sp. StC3 TaxID=2126741 RepID=UPI000D0CC70D|nr:HAMP domain-containing sensor histidine kinase [Nitratireductor sp. StC3]PSM16333.1 sensor histidine kinase [Nitratireductor sp. StC3]
MRRYAPGLKAALPFASLGIALLLCGGAFVRSEQYRAESDLNYSQTYEVQWRTTQIREHLARIHGDLRLAAATSRMQADLKRQVFLLNANVDQLLKLEYAPKFLGDRDVELLRGLQAVASDHLDPILEGSTDFGGALQVMPDLEQRMFEVSGTAVAHAGTLNTTAHIEEAAWRNRFLFAVALVLAAVGYTIMHLRNALTRRQEQHLRSFSSLYAHMTRSRVTALKLFLGYQDEESVKHPDMLAPAREAVQQLEAITNGLAAIAYANRDTRRESLTTVLDQLKTIGPCTLHIRIRPGAAQALVPAAPMRLILDELVQNAEAALVDRPKGQITVAAKVNDRRFSKRRDLVVEVLDDGPGMSADVMAKAKTPFFSTRAGRHTGLGLTGCAQMAAAFNGTLVLNSEYSKGTSVRVSIPIEPFDCHE